jgi:hypothetical protein
VFDDLENGCGYVLWCALTICSDFGGLKMSEDVCCCGVL